MGLNKPGGGTLPTNTPHNDLINRTAVDSHPIGAITGLQADLDAKATAIGTANSNSTTALSQSATALTNSTEAETKSDDALLKIGTLANLQTSNKTDLVQALNENFTNANNGKSAIATAVNGKGGTANASMTFSQLASAVTGIPNIDEATGDAVASNVLAGKTFSNDVGNGITGTMPNQSGTVKTGTSPDAVSGQGARALVPAGYYDGATRVLVPDTDLVAGNIKSGVNLFGLVGTLVEGKPFATGVVDLQGVGSTLTISGLSFQPDVVFAVQVGSGAGSLKSFIFYGSDLYKPTAHGTINTYDYIKAWQTTAYDVSGFTNQFSTTASSFSIMITANDISSNLRWYAVRTS